MLSSPAIAITEACAFLACNSNNLTCTHTHSLSSHLPRLPAQQKKGKQLGPTLYQSTTPAVSAPTPDAADAAPVSSYYVFFPSYYFFFVSTPTPDAAAAARMCAFTRVISHASTPMRWCPRIFLCVIHAHTHTHTHTHVYIYIYYILHIHAHV